MKIKLIIFLNLFVQIILFGQEKIDFDLPNGLILTSSNCAAECCPKQEKLYLFEDRNCALRQIVNLWNFDRLTYFGTWTFRDSLIIINYNRYVGGKGIGVGTKDLRYGCSGVGYESYKAFSKEINSWDTINWVDFKNREMNSSRPIYADYNRKPLSHRADIKDINFLYSKISNEAVRVYSKQYLCNLTKTELKLIRNEIFAKYGYIFKSSDLNEHFKKESWYLPKYENVDAFLHQQDKINIESNKIF